MASETPSEKSRFYEILFFLIAVLSICIMPFILSNFGRSLVIQIFIYSMFAVSFDLLLGYLGLLSFGHVAFWGWGVYAYAILFSRAPNIDFWIALAIAILSGLILAVVIGLIVIRTTGVYFAFVNFALAQLLASCSLKWRWLTGGEEGISGLPRPWNLDGVSFYYLIFGFFLFFFLLIRWITGSRYGKTLIGIRENPSRMGALGYNIWAYKFSCFVIAGLLGTVSGFLFGSYNRFASPDDFAFTVTGMALLMVLIGGKASQVGATLGAAIIILLYQFVSAFTQHWLLAVGIIFVLVVLYAKEGLVGFSTKVWKWAKNGSSEGI